MYVMYYCSFYFDTNPEVIFTYPQWQEEKKSWRIATRKINCFAAFAHESCMLFSEAVGMPTSTDT